MLREDYFKNCDIRLYLAYNMDNMRSFCIEFRSYYDDDYPDLSYYRTEAEANIAYDTILKEIKMGLMYH